MLLYLCKLNAIKNFLFPLSGMNCDLYQLLDKYWNTVCMIVLFRIRKEVCVPMNSQKKRFEIMSKPKEGPRLKQNTTPLFKIADGLMLLHVVAGTAVQQPYAHCLCWAPIWRPLIGRDATGVAAGDGSGTPSGKAPYDRQLWSAFF